MTSQTHESIMLMYSHKSFSLLLFPLACHSSPQPPIFLIPRPPAHYRLSVRPFTSSHFSKPWPYYFFSSSHLHSISSLSSFTSCFCWFSFSLIWILFLSISPIISSSSSFSSFSSFLLPQPSSSLHFTLLASLPSFSDILFFHLLFFPPPHVSRLLCFRLSQYPVTLRPASPASPPLSSPQ